MSQIPSHVVILFILRRQRVPSYYSSIAESSRRSVITDIDCTTLCYPSMIAFTLSTPLSIRATSSSANKLSDARRNVRAWSVPIRTRRSYGARMCDKPQPPEGSTITQALEISFRSVWVSLVRYRIFA